jgi:hypothetical protein
VRNIENYKTNILAGFDVILYDVFSPYLFSFLQSSTRYQQSSTTSSFQSKARIVDNMPSQKVTIGDITIAYKQLGESGAKPIILKSNWHYQTIPLLFLITGVQENQLQGQKNFQSADLQMTQRVCLIL